MTKKKPHTAAARPTLPTAGQQHPAGTTNHAPQEGTPVEQPEGTATPADQPEATDPAGTIAPPDGQQPGDETPTAEQPHEPADPRVEALARLAGKRDADPFTEVPDDPTPSPIALTGRKITIDKNGRDYIIKARHQPITNAEGHRVTTHRGDTVKIGKATANRLAADGQITPAK